MIITFFGSCLREYLNRAPVSFLVEDGDSNLLIDCGSGFISGMKKANKSASDINNVLLTHVHGDHISSIAYFIWYRNFDKKSSDKPLMPLHVYGQKDTIELTKFNVSHMYPNKNHLENVIFHEIAPDSKFECGDLKVTAIKAVHSVPCVGCTIESNGKKLVYTSDTIPTDEILPYSQSPDLLIHEGMLLTENEEFAKKVTHSTGKWAGEVAKKVNAKALAMVHIEPGIFGRENELVEEARKEYSGFITIPVEGTIFNI